MSNESATSICIDPPLDPVLPMNPQLLIIEDEDQIRQNLVELLSLSGFAVSSTSSGQIGLNLARQHLPALILCNVMMLHMDGYQVLEAIRADPSLAHLPFIFLTAKTDRVDLRRGMNLGADDYLTKPFLLKDLLAAIDSRLKRQQPPRPPTGFLNTIQGHNQKGTMILLAADCLFFFVTNRQYFVRHRMGTYQINLNLDTLAAQLDPSQFFRANRQCLLHRKTVLNYAYWDKGKYCLSLDLMGQSQETILTIARFSQFKHWLASGHP